MWCLAIRNVVRCFLQLNDLFVCKTATIMNNLHRVHRLAGDTRTFGRFGDLASVNINLYAMIAYRAPEESFDELAKDLLIQLRTNRPSYRELLALFE